MTSEGLRTFTYDALGVTTGVNSIARRFRFLYTADNERLAAVELLPAGNRTTWTLRGLDNQLLRTWSDASSTGTSVAWKEDVIRRGSLLLASETSSGTRHYILDHLGSPRLVSDATGNHTQSFSPFGEGGTSDGGALQFTGHERDNAEFGDGTAALPDYMHARFYDPGAGRFGSLDPLGGNAYRPQTWNRYSYALNNPLRYTDPTGLYPCQVRGSDGEDHPGECVDVISHYDRDLAEWNAWNRSPDQGRLLRQARRGDDFAAMQLNFSREIHDPRYTTNIAATHDEFLIVAPLMGVLRRIGMAGGEIGLKAATEETASFFDGATFNLKGKLDGFHDFPESVMAFEDAGTVTTIPSSGGATSQMLRIPGSYIGKEGYFEFIKNHMNEITHYFFNPNP